MWVMDDGQYLGEHKTWNRASQFGDGLFETLVVREGEILALQQHVNRMEQGCEVLNLQQPSQGLYKVFEGCKQTLLEKTGLNSGTLKIIARRADSARGYSYDNNQMVFTAFFTQSVASTKESHVHGVNMQHCQTQCSIQPQLAGLKHLNRLENVLAKSELSPNNFEGLMCNAFGYIVEGTMSNVFFEKKGQLFTPKLDVSGVQGVMRGLLMKYCEQHEIPVQECNIKKDVLEDFDSMFVCNSLIGVVPVKQLDQKIFPIGSITKNLLKAWCDGELYE